MMRHAAHARKPHSCEGREVLVLMNEQRVAVVQIADTRDRASPVVARALGAQAGAQHDGEKRARMQEARVKGYSHL